MRATDQALTRAEQHRRNRDSELIDDASIEVLAEQVAERRASPAA
jgi:hypothetical protein